MFQCPFRLARPTSVSVVFVSLRLTPGDVTPGIIGVTRLREVDVDGWILHIVVPKKAVDSLKLTQWHSFENMPMNVVRWPISTTNYSLVEMELCVVKDPLWTGDQIGLWVGKPAWWDWSLLGGTVIAPKQWYVWQARGHMQFQIKQNPYKLYFSRNVYTVAYNKKVSIYNIYIYNIYIIYI